ALRMVAAPGLAPAPPTPARLPVPARLPAPAGFPVPAVALASGVAAAGTVPATGTTLVAGPLAACPWAHSPTAPPPEGHPDRGGPRLRTSILSAWRRRTSAGRLPNYFPVSRGAEPRSADRRVRRATSGRRLVTAATGGRLGGYRVHLRGRHHRHADRGPGNGTTGRERRSRGVVDQHLPFPDQLAGLRVEDDFGAGAGGRLVPADRHTGPAVQVGPLLDQLHPRDQRRGPEQSRPQVGRDDTTAQQVGDVHHGLPVSGGALAGGVAVD